MSAQGTITKQLRSAVKHIPGAWVRVWRDGTQWAGSREHTKGAQLEVKTALEEAGYLCVCAGQPGTEGEFIIDVVGKNQLAVSSRRLSKKRAR